MANLQEITAAVVAEWLTVGAQFLAIHSTPDVVAEYGVWTLTEWFRASVAIQRPVRLTSRDLEDVCGLCPDENWAVAVETYNPIRDWPDYRAQLVIALPHWGKKKFNIAFTRDDSPAMNFTLVSCEELETA